jgi:hypothetical protein
VPQAQLEQLVQLALKVQQVPLVLREQRVQLA